MPSKPETARRRVAIRQEIIRKLKLAPCADCRQTFDPVCMDFDHLPGAEKQADVSRMTSYSTKRLLEEIAKCEVVCANCHRLRTKARWVANDI